MQITQVTVHAQEHRNVGDYSSYESYVSFSATVFPHEDAAEVLATLAQLARASAVADCDRFELEKAERERLEQVRGAIRRACNYLHASLGGDEIRRRITKIEEQIAELPEAERAGFEQMLSAALPTEEEATAADTEADEIPF